MRASTLLAGELLWRVQRRLENGIFIQPRPASGYIWANTGFAQQSQSEIMADRTDPEGACQTQLSPQLSAATPLHRHSTAPWVPRPGTTPSPSRAWLLPHTLGPIYPSTRPPLGPQALRPARPAQPGRHGPPPPVLVPAPRPKSSLPSICSGRPSGRPLGPGTGHPSKFSRP